MKITIWLFAFLLSVSGFAQITSDEKQQSLLGQGKLHAGVSTALGYGGYVGRSIHVVPRVQYFLKDGWSIAAEYRYDDNSGSHTTFKGVGLNTRYYFLRLQHFAAFGGLSATYGQSKYFIDARGVYGMGGAIRKNSFQTNAELGIHYRLSSRWLIEASTERMLTKPAIPGIDASPWRTRIGVSFRLGK